MKSFKNMENQELSSFLDSTSKISVLTQLFKNGDYDFVVKGVGRSGKTEYHEKQREALKTLMANTYKRFVYGGAAGGGKAQAMDSKVYTPFGYKLMKDIKVGDVIKHPRGGNTNVIAIHPQGKKKLYEVTFSDGAKTKCCGEHLWHVWFASDKSNQENNLAKGRVQTTEMLLKKLHRNPTIPLTEPIEFATSVNRCSIPIWKKVHPYILGVLISDGSLTKSLEFYSADIEIVDKVRLLLPSGFKVNKRSQKYCYSITHNKKNEKGFGVNEIYDLIRELGLNCKSEFKHIPSEIHHSPLWVRREIIKGLMDTDGTCSKKGHCSYSTSSEKLSLDFQYIVRSLGFKCKINRKKTTHLDSFNLSVEGKDKKSLFHLSRKKERAIDFNGCFYEVGRRIVSIDEIEPEQSQCITVHAADGLYVTDDFVVTHNSWVGCTWLLFMCILYPKTRWFVARNELGDIVKSVYVTFCKVCDAYGFKGYKFNSVKNFIEFDNGSFIGFIEIKYKPSDPEFTDLGSTEYTGGWVEEAGEVNMMGVTILGTRTGRHLNLEYGIKPIVFITCNPAQNWIKHQYYDKWEKGELKNNEKYLSALAVENPFLPQSYIDDLKDLADKSQSAYLRLFKGDWNYVDSPNALVDMDALESIFENDHVQKGTFYLTADIATLGSDLAVIGVWCGWQLVDIKTLAISSTQDIERVIYMFRMKYKIPKTRCIADADGVGGAVVSGAGIRAFKNNGKVIKEKGNYGMETPEYRNLQVQCLYRLAEIINEGKIWLNCDLSSDQKVRIKKELYQIQSNNKSYRKLDCKSKEDIKQDIKGSPDYRDMIFMRVWFDLKPSKPRFLSSKPRNTI